jgi:hypothetical protein
MKWAFSVGWSKKLVAFLLTVAVILLNRFLDLGFSEDELLILTGGFGAYAISQGISDAGFTGKVKAETEAIVERKAIVAATDEKEQTEK